MAVRAWSPSKVGEDTRRRRWRTLAVSLVIAGGVLAGGASSAVGAVPFARHDALIGAGQSDVEVGDLNGDGRPDLAIANADDDAVSVLLGDGDGGFRLAAHVA